MILNLKKAISPVVATALLLVVAVVSVVGFSSWMSEFSSGVFVDVEKDSLGSSSVRVDGLINDILYLKSSNSGSVDILKIYSNNGSEVCEFNSKKNSFNFTNGLVAHWKFDDEDSTIKDYSGNGYDGNLFGDTSLFLDFNDNLFLDETSYKNNVIEGGSPNCNVLGVYGNACYFDGNDSVFTGSINLGINFSTSFWISKNSTNYQFERIYVIAGLYLIKAADGTLYFTMYNGSSFLGSVKSNFKIKNNSYSHILINTFKVGDDSIVQLYIDSVLDFEHIYYNQSRIDLYQNFQFGGSDSFYGDYFTGFLDEFVIYNRKLSQDEIKNIYSYKKAKFIEFVDSNNNKAIELNGKSNYVNISNSTNLYFNSNLTIVALVSDVKDKNVNTIISKTKNILSNTSFALDFQPGILRYFRYDSITLNPIISSSINHKINFNDKSYDFVAGVYNTSYGVKSYLNGLNVGSDYNLTLSYLNNDAPIKIGSRILGDSRSFGGRIDEIRIYDRVLNIEDLNILMWNLKNNLNTGVSKLDLSNCNLEKGINYNVMGFTDSGSKFDVEIINK